MLLAISPHCDDAVFACGERLCAHPGALVVTVFAGDPPLGHAATPWDRDCGFAPGDDVMAARRAEDRRAFARIGARGAWLPFRDRQYAEPPPVEDIAAALDALLARESPDEVCFPLGLFHSDHVLASDAALRVAARFPRVAWAAYEDALYRGIDGAVAARVAALRERGFLLERRQQPSDAITRARKRAAVACYASQLRGLHTPARLGHEDALAPEALWRLST
jgi:LmbE family N-acetylglucosaminyl deacetylase